MTELMRLQLREYRSLVRYNSKEKTAEIRQEIRRIETALKQEMNA